LVSRCAGRGGRLHLDFDRDESSGGDRVRFARDREDREDEDEKLADHGNRRVLENQSSWNSAWMNSLIPGPPRTRSHSGPSSGPSYSSNTKDGQQRRSNEVQRVAISRWVGARRNP